MATFCDSCAYELNNTPTSPHYTCIKSAYQPVKCWQSPIYSTASLLFCAILAVEEVEVGGDDAPKVDFRPFQEWEAQNDDSLANIHTQRRHAEVGMVVAYHLGGRLGA